MGFYMSNPKTVAEAALVLRYTTNLETPFNNYVCVFLYWSHGAGWLTKDTQTLQPQTVADSTKTSLFKSQMLAGEWN